MDQLDNEERDLLRTYELGEWKSVAKREAEMERCREYARATLNEVRIRDNRNPPNQGRPS